MRSVFIKILMLFLLSSGGSFLHARSDDLSGGFIGSFSSSKCPTSSAAFNGSMNSMLFGSTPLGDSLSSSNTLCGPGGGGPGPGTLNVVVNSVTVNRGQEAIFNALVTGGTQPYTISWDINTGAGFVPANLVSGVIVNGAQLIITGTNMDYLRAGQYRATVFDSGNPVASGVAIGTLTVNVPTVLTATSNTLTGGATLNLTAAPQVAGLNVTYQLFRNSNLPASSATGSFSFANASNLNEGTYEVRAIYNNFSGTPYGGSPLSNALTVTVNVPPASVSLSGPVGAVTVGTSVTLTATAITAPNGDPATSYVFMGPNGFSQTTTSNSLTISNVQLSHAGAWTVVASNAGGSTAPSAAYALQVNPAEVAPSGVTLTRLPSNATVLAGSSVTFTASATAGTNLSYSFFRVGSTTPIAGSSGNTLVINSVNESHQGSYFVSASNTLGSSDSATVSLDVLSAPTAATLSTPAATVEFGSTIILTAGSIGGDVASGYRFYRNGALVQEGPSNQLVINSANQATHGGVYHVVAFNAAGSSSNSSSITLQVNPAPTGLSLLIDTPEDGQVGVSTRPLITWTLYNNGIPVAPNETPSLVPAGSVFRLKITRSADCTTVGFPTVNGNLEMQAREFAQNEFDLLNNTAYYVCVRLESADGLTGVTNWDTNAFTTRLAAIPLVNLRTEPTSSAAVPSGDVNFKIVAEANETGSFVYFYEFDSAGVLIGEIGSAQLNAQGRAEIIASVSDPTKDDVVGIKARIHRSASDIGPLPSSTTDYFYKVDAGLTPPSISSDCDGVITWNSTGANHSYDVFRRVNKEEFGPNPEPDTFYNNNLTPYRRIASIPASGNISISFPDPDFSTLNVDSEGLNYFVTASDGSRSSRASNPVNCFDAELPRVAEHSLQVIKRADGSTLDFYMTESSSITSNFMDNDSHRIAYIQMVQTNSSCSSVSWDDDRDTTLLQFDTLTRITDLATPGLRNAIPIGTASFPTGAAYCAIVCMLDTSTDRTALQERSPREDISTHQNRVCLNSDDPVVLTPNFFGIETLTALDNGTSMKVTWSPVAQEQGLGEFVDYVVELVEIPSRTAPPNFESSSKISDRISDIGAREVIISGLKSGAYYAARVEAIAVGFEPDLRAGGDEYRTARTVNLSPQVLSADISFPYGTMTKAVLTMQIRQLQPSIGLSGLGMGDPLSVRFSGFSVSGGQAREVRMNDLERRVIRGSSIVRGMQLPSETATMEVVLDTSEVLTQYDRAGFNFKLQVENSMGMVTQYSARATPEKGLVAANENKSPGCGPKSVSTHQHSSKALALLVLSFIAILGVKRRRLLLQR